MSDSPFSRSPLSGPSASGSGSSAAGGFQPHAYDPATQPELFDGVLARRLIAFVIDVLVLTVPVVFAWIAIAIFGVLTLGLGWMLYWIFSPAVVIWILAYYGMTMGGPNSATVGMRVMDLEIRTWYGAPCYFLLGAVHAIVYWITLAVLTPLVLVVGLLNGRRRLLHDFLCGTVVINNSVRVGVLRAGRTASSSRVAD